MSNIPADGGEYLNKSKAFIGDLLNRRNVGYKGHTNIRSVELLGGRIIEPTAFEPDPSTYRGEYYYNAVTNALYRRIITRRSNGITFAHWRKCSD